MIFVVIWFLDYFTLEPVPLVNGVWIIAFVNHPHVWATKFKPLLMVFQLTVLTSNNVVWMPFPTILFDEAQHLNILKAKLFRPAAGIIRNTQQRHLYYNFQASARSFLIRRQESADNGDV